MTAAALSAGATQARATGDSKTPGVLTIVEGLTWFGAAAADTRATRLDDAAVGAY
jgi:hypothetical protein